MKKLIILFLLLFATLTPIFSSQLVTNVALSSGKDTLNDNTFFGSAALCYAKEKRQHFIAAELNEHETTFTFFSRWKIGKQTDTRITHYENLRFKESRDMFSILSFGNAYYYYGISSTYSLGTAISFSFENKGPIRLGTNLMAGAYTKASIINYINNPIVSIAPFALINVYLDFYNRFYFQTEVSTGSIFYLPTNFAYDLTFLIDASITDNLSVGCSITTGLADSFAETAFSNRYSYTIFVNWGANL